ncbi:LysR substrate-binding domain-containing protein [Ramlibacter sp. PS4R-6]|uniref:LysR substrate-binding domain-containing protein n=1 Tax=Ramlibacter sp. PS4R-6 TaxID=3133438 RepID=UPI0030A51F19
MRDLDLTSLRLFVTVCETGNISRAGERANIVGSAISKRLAQLEDAVGTPLLARKRHGVQPTPAGRTLLEHARSVLATVGAIERDMEAYAAGARGQVRILASASALAESLAQDIATFLHKREHARIQVDLEERVSPDIVRGIHDGTASLGVCWDATDTAGLHSKPYRMDELAVVVPRGHALASRKRVKFEDTLPYEHVSLPANSAVQVLFQREAARVGQKFNHRVIVTNFEAALRVVRASLAICLVPREVAEIYADAYELRIIPLAETWARRRFIIVYRDEAALTPAALLLLQHLAAQAPAP